MNRATSWWCRTRSCSTAPSPSRGGLRRSLPPLRKRLSQRPQSDPPQGLKLLAVYLRLLREQLAHHLRRELDVDASRHLGGERAQPEGVVRLVAFHGQVDAHLVQLQELRPTLDLGAPGLRRVGEVEAIDAAKDAVALTQRSRHGLRDACLPEVVAHVLEDRSGRRYAADRQRQSRHE